MSQDVNDSPRCTLLYCCNGSKSAGHKATESQSSVEVDANAELPRELAPESQQNKELEKVIRYVAYHGTTLTTEAMIDKAIAAIEVLIDRARIDEVSRALSQPKKTWQPVGGISNIQWQETSYLEERLANLKSKGEQ